jgi:hypothetical protein
MAPPNDVIVRGVGGTAQASRTPEEIYAHGDVATRLAIIRLVTYLSLVLGIGGIWIWISNPEKAKDFWVIVGPIISGSVIGVIGFITGERQTGKRKK